VNTNLDPPESTGFLTPSPTPTKQKHQSFCGLAKNACAGMWVSFFLDTRQLATSLEFLLAISENNWPKI
jgi:hypothetical protein